MLKQAIRLLVLLLVLFGVADSAYYLPGVTPAAFADTESVRIKYTNILPRPANGMLLSAIRCR